MRDTLPVDTDRWWRSDLPPLRTRLRAYLEATLTLGITHELRTTLAVEPTVRLERAGQSDTIELDIYKLWYVIHHDRSGDDRTTTLRKKRVGQEHTTVENVRETAVETPLLPLDPGWPTVDPADPDNLVADTDQEGDRDA